MVRRSEQGQALIELLIGCFILFTAFFMLIKVELTGINQIKKYQFSSNKERNIELPKHLKKKFYLHEDQR